MNGKQEFTGVWPLTGVAIVLAGGLTFAASAPAISILPGSDYLTTAPGTMIDLGKLGSPWGLGVVEFAGNPVGPGDTDTVIERQGTPTVDAPGDTDTVEIELVGLSLASVNPVDVGGILYDLHIDLDPALPSLGAIEITLGNDTVPSGDFTAFLDIFVEVAQKRIIKM